METIHGRRIINRQCAQIYAQTSGSLLTFDLTNPLYGGLTIMPDYFKVVCMTHQQNKTTYGDFVSVLVTNIIDQNITANRAIVVSLGVNDERLNITNLFKYKQSVNLNATQFQLFDINNQIFSPSTLTIGDWVLLLEFYQLEKII